MLLKTAMCAILELGNRGLLPLIHVIASPIRGAAIKFPPSLRAPAGARQSNQRRDILLLDCRVVVTPRNDS